ncbi:FAR1-related sequence 5-like protein [Tanacetum coccineum]
MGCHIIKAANANIGAVGAHNLYTGLKGSSSLVHGTQTEFKNFTRGVNCFIGDSDAQMLITRMKERQEFTKDFSFDYFFEDAELCGLFWADEVAKCNYKEFGDIVSFDATYKTNTYEMVFVPFTTIDNHRRSVIVGSGLLKKETTEAYGWLLRAFKKAFVRAPNIVVTDQDGAIRLAVAAEFPKFSEMETFFGSMDGMDAILDNYPWFIRNTPLILKRWTQNANLLQEDVGKVLVREKLDNFPITTFNEDRFSAIATKLGTLLLLETYKSAMCMEIIRDVLCTLYVLNISGNVSNVLKNLNDPRQAAKGVTVGPKLGSRLARQEVSNSNPFDALNSVENDDDLDTNGGGDSDLFEVDSQVNSDNESEVEEVFNETPCFMASTSLNSGSGSGYRTKSLLEQWKETSVDDDYDPYDDDVYEDKDIS